MNQGFSHPFIISLYDQHLQYYTLPMIMPGSKSMGMHTWTEGEGTLSPWRKGTQNAVTLLVGFPFSLLKKSVKIMPNALLSS